MPDLLANVAASLLCVCLYLYLLQRNLSTSLVAEGSPYLAKQLTDQELLATTYDHIDVLQGLDRAELRQMNHIVLGAAGLCGEEIVNLLCKAGCDAVLAVDVAKRPSTLAESANFVQCNITDSKAVSTVFARAFENRDRPTAIYHTASVIRSHERFEYLKDLSWKVNVDGTANVLSAAKQCFHKVYFVYTSTAPIDSPSPGLAQLRKREYLLTDEMPRLDPSIMLSSWYFKSKRAAESLVNAANNADSFRTVNLRCGMALMGVKDLMISFCGRHLIDFNLNPTIDLTLDPNVTWARNLAHNCFDAQDVARAHLFAALTLAQRPQDCAGQSFRVTGQQQAFRFHQLRLMTQVFAGRDLKWQYVPDVLIFVVAQIIEKILYLRYQILSLGGRRIVSKIPPSMRETVMLQPGIIETANVDVIIDDSRFRKVTGYHNVWSTAQTIKRISDAFKKDPTLRAGFHR